MNFFNIFLVFLLKKIKKNNFVIFDKKMKFFFFLYNNSINFNKYAALTCLLIKNNVPS